MNCDKCGASIPDGDEREHYSQTLCEDCYMDTLSPTRTCDPWAVHSAKTLEQSGAAVTLTTTQSEILSLLRETGGAEPGYVADRLSISMTELEREIAALRHMEKVRGELREGRKYIILW